MAVIRRIGMPENDSESRAIRRLGKGIAVDTSLLRQVLEQAGEALRDPAGAAEVIARMCAPQRDERYANLADVLEDLAIIEY